MSRTFARYAAAVLALTVGVILWGAFVRISGSGAGCGNHWPLCNGVVVPLAPTIATLIEFTHRMMSGLDGIAIGVLVVWAFRVFPRRHPVRLGVVLTAIFLATEVLVGAALVKLEHVARNASVGRAYSLSGHLINTLTLLACLTLTIWWASGGARLTLRGRAAWLAIPGLALFVILGISGAIAALGDTLFPARSLAEGIRQDLEPAASIFVRLRLFHPLLAVGTAAWLGFYAAIERQKAGWLCWSLLGLVTLEIAAGGLNLWLLAPWWMQMVHLLLADLAWIALILVCASALEKPPAPAVPADQRANEMASGARRPERLGQR